MTDPQTIRLPSGGSATIGDIKLIRGGDKRNIRLKFASMGINGLIFIAQAEMAKLLITEWSLPYAPDAKLPREDPDVYDSIEPDDADAIEAIIEPLVNVLFPPPADPADAAKPGSPTEPADV